MTAPTSLLSIFATVSAHLRLGALFGTQPGSSPPGPPSIIAPDVESQYVFPFCPSIDNAGAGGGWLNRTACSTLKLLICCGSQIAFPSILARVALSLALAAFSQPSSSKVVGLPLSVLKAASACLM